LHEEERRPPQTRSLPRGFSPLTEDPDLRPQHGTSPPLLLRRILVQTIFLERHTKKGKKKNGGQEHRETKHGEIDQRKNNRRRRGEK
jgi:hypothetical protein